MNKVYWMYPKQVVMRGWNMYLRSMLLLLVRWSKTKEGKCCWFERIGAPILGRCRVAASRLENRWTKP